MPPIEPRTLRGFPDTLPPTVATRNRMVARISDVFASFGYEPFDTPALEYADILKGKGGEESDKQLYEFDDAGGRRVALRFDLTVPLARFVAQHHNALAFPFRGYHIAPAWRGERPQHGRLREFVQCDADIIGEVDVMADAEILCMFQAALGEISALGAGPFVIRVNDRWVLNGLLVDLDLADRSGAVLRAVDKLDKLGRDVVFAELTDAGVSAGAADQILGFCQTTAETTDDTLDAIAEVLKPDGVGAAGLASLRQLIDVMAAGQADMTRVRVDPSIARGLDYYTGMVFETVLERAPQIGSVCSGGRYDDLASLYSSRRFPGVGGSIGISRILAALETTGELAVPGGRPLVAITHGAQDAPAVLVRLAAGIRATGVFDVVASPSAGKHGTQMKYADHRGAVYVLTLEGDGAVSVKDMRSGERSAMPAAEAPARLAELAAATQAT